MVGYRSSPAGPGPDLYSSGGERLKTAGLLPLVTGLVTPNKYVMEPAPHLPTKF